MCVAVQAKSWPRCDGTALLFVLQAKLQAREDALKEQMTGLRNTEEQLRTKVSRLQGSVDSSRQRESELAVIRINLNDSVAKIQASISQQSNADDGVSPSSRAAGKHAELREHIAAMKVGWLVGWFASWLVLLVDLLTWLVGRCVVVRGLAGTHTYMPDATLLTCPDACCACILQEEHSDLDSQLEKLQKEFTANNELLEDLFKQTKADEKKMEELRAQVCVVVSGNINAVCVCMDG